jgi:hypothetical protein
MQQWFTDKEVVAESVSETVFAAFAASLNVIDKH